MTTEYRRLMPVVADLRSSRPLRAIRPGCDPMPRLSVEPTPQHARPLFAAPGTSAGGPRRRPS